MYNKFNILSDKNKFSFLKKDCHIWYINIYDSLYIKSLENIESLSIKEKEKLCSFRFQDDKVRFAISHIALRKIINYYTEIPFSLIKYKYNKYDKAYLSNDIPFPLFFNLSHAYNKVVIAINNTEVGVDVEYKRNSSDIYELAELIFSNFERQSFLSLKNHNDKLDYFYTIWTKKEAYLKALSIGLVDDLKKIHLGSELQSKVNKKFVIQNIDVDDNEYIAKVAFKSNKYKNILYYNY